MNPYISLALFVWGYMTVWFIISLIKKRNDVADIAWGLGFLFVSMRAYSLTPHGPTTDVESVALIVSLMVAIWGIRLAYHIYRRNHGKPEDYRYAKWRSEWGKWFVLRSYAQVYVLQGFLMYIIALPVMVIQISNAYIFGPLEYIGIAVWAVGFLCESAADRQLALFVRDSNNTGKIMQSGLWKYSRHPNYFGEVTQWWGIWIISLGVGGWWAVVGPLTITFLILFVSGVPLLEKKMAEKPEFAEYKRKTSVLVPWWPKK